MYPRRKGSLTRREFTREYLSYKVLIRLLSRAPPFEFDRQDHSFDRDKVRRNQNRGFFPKICFIEYFIEDVASRGQLALLTLFENYHSYSRPTVAFAVTRLYEYVRVIRAMMTRALRFDLENVLS